MTAAVLSLARVTKRFGAQVALSEVSLTVAPGECLALLGHNGAGKTTLLKLALGLIRPSGGRVWLLGVDPALGDARTVRRAIGFIPENLAFHDAMTGRETLDFYARLKGEAVARNDELLERVGLTEAAGRRIKTYSKGMRQRLGLAQALLGEPRLVLLDEPTTGLDPASRQRFYELIHELTARGGTIVLSSHALTELETHVSRVAILDGGRLVACGPIAELGRAARLTAKIRISVAPGCSHAVAAALPANGALERLNERTIELSCPLADKLSFLQRISRLEIPIEDVEIASPRLDDVFVHFTEMKRVS